MSSLPFMPLYGRDFRSDTEHLRARESGAYLLLMMTAWEMPKCRLPDDDRLLSAWARVDTRVWAKIKPLVMAFWVLKDGYWTQTRLRLEWDNAQKRVATSRANGKRGGRPKSNKPKDNSKPAGFDPVNPGQTGSKAHYTNNHINNNTKLASLSPEAAREPLAGLSEIVDDMVSDICRWVPSMDDAGAKSWLATQRKLFGSAALREGYGKLKTDTATGDVIARPLQAWSEISRRYHSKIATPETKSFAEKASEASAAFVDMTRKKTGTEQTA